MIAMVFTQKKNESAAVKSVNGEAKSSLTAGALLATILLLGTLLRVNIAKGYYYNPDEMLFLMIAKAPSLYGVWQRGLFELHPPFWHFVNYYYLMLVDDVMSHRMLPIVLSGLSILGIFKLGVKIRSRQLGIFLAVAIAFLPVTVTTSAVIRNYALFFALLTWALYFWVRYTDLGRRLDLLMYLVLTWFSCATHFPGFLVCGALFSVTGFLLVARRQWRSFMLLVVLHIPLMALGILFYRNFLAEGASGPMWRELAVVAASYDTSFQGAFLEAVTKLLLYFIPFLNMCPELTIGSLMGTSLQIWFGLLIFWFFIRGLQLLNILNRPMLMAVLAVYVVATAAATLAFYPINLGRHIMHLLPFFLIPIGVGAERLVACLTRSAVAGVALAVSIIALVLGMYQSGVYRAYGSEFALKTDDLNRGLEYIARETGSGDILIPNIFYQYLLYNKDRGETATTPYKDLPYLNGTTILEPFNNPTHPHRDWSMFYDFLYSSLSRPSQSLKGRHWFLSLGWDSIPNRMLLSCEVAKPYVDRYYYTEGVLIYAIPSSRMVDMLSQKEALADCFINYQSLTFASRVQTPGNPILNR